MRYAVLLLCISLAVNVQAQQDDPVTVMAKIMCECIENDSENMWETAPGAVVKSCERAAVLGGLLSAIPVTDDENSKEQTAVKATPTQIGQEEMNEVSQLLQKDCEKYQEYAKTATADSKQLENIAGISKDACICLDDVSQGLEKEVMYDEIRNCIEGAITASQIQSKLFGTLQKMKDSTSVSPAIGTTDTTTASNNVEITIVTDLNYEEVEEHLLRNCDRMQQLITTENTQNENSVSDKKEAVLLYEKGMDVYREKDFEKAISIFKKALRKDKNFAFAYDMIGVSYRRMNDFNKAIKFYEKSLAIDPKGRMPLMNIPIAYALLEDYDKSIEGYLKFMTIFPEDPEGFYGIGRIYHLKGDYEKALDNMMKAFVMYNEAGSPYARDAETNLGLFYRELKAQNKLDLFKRMAKKHKIEIGTD